MATSPKEKRNKIDEYGIFVAQEGNNAVDKINNIKPVRTFKQFCKDRPDIVFLAVIGFALISAFALYGLAPYFQTVAPPIYTATQLEMAKNLPESAFTLDEISKVDLEVKGLESHASYFTSNPYSLANSGIYDLLLSVAILPLVMFFIMFVLPPLILAYGIWFMLRFWPYVMHASWGWFLAMYSYFNDLIQGKLGCKWYIRMVTGWRCRNPNFNTYVTTWRRRYVDRPVYEERLKYMQTFVWAKRKFYDIPLEKYINLPLKKLMLTLKYAKKIYIDRAFDIFLKTLKKNYPIYYERPRDEFYNWLLEKNKPRT